MHTCPTCGQACDCCGDIEDHDTGCEYLDDCACCLGADEELEDDEPGICPACNGSGEGQYDGSRCGSCGGWGEQRVSPEPDPDDRRDHDREDAEFWRQS